ncbi:hypothetical protein K3172_07485 [Qipengyuania sp. 6B39]|uniref:hypothetical protein n=1 Tax=Qipengyuania proteolytica TaxID=2867239 RepID=UPI001C8A9B65|nr:hypothetical protein [Qipengyuania proteolytica]MBX7495697.1 hypothetical protein [Qipengyuania proteolytica]
MFALFLIALLALTAVAALGVLADSGLRWWSAFGQLRREMRMTSATVALPSLRPAIAKGGHTAFGRCSVSAATGIQLKRAA